MFAKINVDVGGGGIVASNWQPNPTSVARNMSLFRHISAVSNGAFAKINVDVADGACTGEMHRRDCGTEYTWVTRSIFRHIAAASNWLFAKINVDVTIYWWECGNEFITEPYFDGKKYVPVQAHSSWEQRGVCKDKWDQSPRDRLHMAKCREGATGLKVFGPAFKFIEINSCK